MYVLIAAAAAAVTSVVSDFVRPHRWQPPRLSHPWDSPGKNTGMGCHFLLLRGIFLTQRLNPCLLLSPALAVDSLPLSHREAYVQINSMPAAAAAAKSLQSCPTLCNPIDGSPPGSPVPGILQARTLEWVEVQHSRQNHVPPPQRCPWPNPPKPVNDVTVHDKRTFGKMLKSSSLGLSWMLHLGPG